MKKIYNLIDESTSMKIWKLMYLFMQKLEKS